MKATSFFSVLLLSTGTVLQASAGAPEHSAADSQDVASASLVEAYTGGRGLVSLTGPTGMFINPTSGTMPQGAVTLQYCFFLPDGATIKPSRHGILGSYGITDSLEVGIFGLYANARDQYSIGPNARYRILKDGGPRSLIPEFSLVGYSRIGDKGFQGFWGLAPTAFKNFPISEDGFLKAIGVHGGLRYEHNDGTSDEHLFSGYAGLELEIPAHLFLVGEVSSKETGRGESETPYAFGVQWRQGLLNISTAGIHNGISNGPKFYFGVGLQGQF